MRLLNISSIQNHIRTHQKKVILFILCTLLAIPFFLLSFKRPFFSIIICSYNYGQFLSQTVQSILNSSYPDFEIIIVNDGSTDNTLEVMEKYAKTDHRIRLISQTNQGLSLARNNAMKIAKGEYFWFVDADDWIDSNALMTLKNAINRSAKTNNTSPDIISFYIQRVDENGNQVPSIQYMKLPHYLLKYTEKQYIGSKLPYNILKSFPVTSGKNIYRADYLTRKKIIFPPKQVFEDNIFFLTALTTGATGIVVPEYLYYKRMHPQQITSNRDKYYDSAIRLPRLIYSQLTQYGVPPDITQTLFSHYINNMYQKWPSNPKYIPDLKKLLFFVREQPQNAFWKHHEEWLNTFIQKIDIKSL